MILVSCGRDAIAAIGSLLNAGTSNTGGVRQIGEGVYVSTKLKSKAHDRHKNANRSDLAVSHT